MKRFKYLFGPPGEQGSITPIVALGLMAFIGFLALGIDLGQLYVVKNEMQNVADGAALAAAKRLVREDPTTKVATIYKSDARDAAVACANDNHSLGMAGGITVNPSDVIMGQWNLATKSFTTTSLSDGPAPVGATNFAVQVTVRRTGSGTNPQVTTFLGGVIGAGSQKDVEATAVAFMDNVGTGSPDVPFTIPADYTNGGGVASNGWQRLIDKVGPAPAYAASQHYEFHDKADGGITSSPSLPANRASWTVAKDTESAGSAAYYAMQKYLQGTERFPQKKVGDKLYPATEHIYGQYLKDYFNWMKTRWNANKDASGKWRVTVPVFKTTPVTASAPQDSWFRLASRLLPGVSQAHACTLILTPVVYTQGFATIDITNVTVKSDCVTTNYAPQRDNTNSCRNKCYMEFDVPLDQNTISSDKGSNPTPYPKDYKDMNPSAQQVGVFAATPRIVK